jgi:RimJ/RimL family protein N-acetyltransferase
MQIETARLRLRDWRDEDAGPFGLINADPEVARWLGGARKAVAQDNDALMWLRAIAVEHGFTLWALETLDGQLIGACGLVPIKPDLPIRPGVEIGWRLDPRHWGQSYATEAAQAVLTHAWSLALPEVLSFTARKNVRSRAVMERLGMTYEPDCDFAHPGLPGDHPLLDHVLYSIRRPA